MAQFVEVDLDQGTNFNLDIVVKNDDDSRINVAGYTFSSSMRKSFYSSGVTANLTVAVISAANGDVRFSLNAATTANIKAGRYVFDPAGNLRLYIKHVQGAEPIAHDLKILLK